MSNPIVDGDDRDAARSRPVKKPRMHDAVNGDDGEEDTSDVEMVEGGTGLRNKPAKRKVALLLGYCGLGYHGMQYNPPEKTIEGDVFQALSRIGAISEANSADPKKVFLMRAARTDKGVHAAGQLMSLKLLMIPNLQESLNAQLPPQIRLLAVYRVLNKFNPKNACFAREYEYFMPTYMLRPFRVGATFLTSQDISDRVNANRLLAAAQKGATEAPSASSVRPKNGSESEEDEEADDVDKEATFFDYLQLPEETEQEKQSRIGYRIDAVALEKVRGILSRYQGTQNFHNFTSGKTSSDASAKRYIIHFRAEEPEVVNDVEWIRLRVKGQSFMLHQIRKMIGLMVLIMNLDVPADVLGQCVGGTKRLVPKAPGIGLFLDKLCFDGYNERLERLHGNTPPLLFTDIEDKMETFKREQIYPAIVRQEEKNQIFRRWLQALPLGDADFDYLKGASPIFKQQPG